VVKLHFFAGLGLAEIGELLELSSPRWRQFDAQRAEHAPDQDLAEAYRAMGEQIEARRRGPGANAAAAQ